MKVLFACYHTSETRTLIQPVAKILHSLGHETAILQALEGSTFEDPVVTRRFICELPKHDPRAISRAELADVIVAGCVPDEWVIASRVSALLWKLYPHMLGVFSVPTWNVLSRLRATWTQIMEWGPDVVALSPGQIEAVAIRQFCVDAGIPFAQLMTPFSEFKSCERMQLPEAARKDTHIVSSAVGKHMLHTQQLVHPENIVTTGAFACVADDPAGEPSAETTLLYVSQEVPENLRLDNALFRYVERNSNVNLILRAHPVVYAGTLRIWDEMVARSAAKGRIHISKLGEPLSEALGKASAVVGLYSVAMYEAMLAGIPVISWSTKALPHDLRIKAMPGITVVRDERQLGTVLDTIRPCGVKKVAVSVGKTQSAAKIAETLLSLPK